MNKESFRIFFFLWSIDLFGTHGSGSNQKRVLVIFNNFQLLFDRGQHIRQGSEYSLSTGTI